MSAGKRDLSAYRSGVGIVLVNGAGLIFSGHRCDNRDHPWQMPQGGLHDGETPEQAVFREIKEELGTDKVSLLTKHRKWLCYDYPSQDISKRAAEYRGQRHIWFLLRFEGRDRDIRLTKGTCEFSHWRWCPPHDIIVNAIAFKQPIYREILGIFAPLIAKTSIPADLPLAATRRRHIA